MSESMKVGELLKRLENIKTHEDDRHEIAEHLVQTFCDKRSRQLFYVMMKDKTVYDYYEYRDLLKSGKVSSNNTYVFIENNPLSKYHLSSYLYPFFDQGMPLVDGISLITAYLSKLGFENEYYHVVPATGLRYIVIIGESPDVNHVAVDVADIIDVIFNTHLPTLIRGVLSTKHSTKHITYDEVKKIISQFILQKLFAGHTFMEAQDILHQYYEIHNTSLAKEVEAIRDAYNRIFKPYRVVYDLKTKQFIV